MRVAAGAAGVGSVARVDDGRFRIAFDARAERWELELVARFLRLAEPLVLDPEAPPSELVLEPELGARVIGRVVPPAGFGGSFAGERVELSMMPTRARSLTMSKREVRVGEDHTFAFDGLPARHEVSLFAHCEPFQGDSTDWFELRAGQEVEIELPVRPGCTVHGRVVREDGTPAGGVLVRRGGLGTFREGRDETRSAEDGTFELGPLHSGKIRIVAEASGTSAEWTTGEVAPGAVVRGVELVLRTPPQIRGVVRFPDGTPAPEVALEYVTVDRGRERLAVSTRDRAVTGSDGTFAMRVDADVSYAFTAHLDDGVAAWGAERERVRAGEQLVLVLVPLPVLAGSVVDDLGQPIEAGRLVLRGDGGRETAPIAGGRFRYAARDADAAWILVAESEGHLPSRERRVPSEGEVTLICPRVGELTVSVVHSTGFPIEDARVSVEAIESDAEQVFELEYTITLGETVESSGLEDSFGRIALGRTDAAGRVVGRPALTEAVRVHARVGKEYVGSSTAFLVPGEAQKVEVRVHHTGSLAGTAFLANGKPAKRFPVVLFAARSEGLRDLRTDGEGRFRVEGLAPGEWRAYLLQRGDEWIELAGADCTVVGTRTLSVELRAERAVSTRIAGRVLDGDVPVAGMEVGLELLEGEGEALRGETDADGRFELVAPRAGRFELELRADGTRLSAVVDATSGGELVFALPEGSIEGRVIDERGEPLGGVAVVARAELDGGSELRAEGRCVTRDDGTFHFAKLPPDRYRIAAGGHGAEEDVRGSARGGRVVTGVEVGDGELVAVPEIVLAPGTVARGVVRDAHGTRIGGAFVHGRDERGVLLDDEPLAVTDADGAFEIAGIVAGRDALFASTRTMLSRAVTVVQGGELALVLEPAGLLLLSVGGSEGGFEPQAWRVRDRQGVEVPLFPDSDEVGGLWESAWGPVPRGSYRLQVRNALGTGVWGGVLAGVEPEEHFALDVE